MKIDKKIICRFDSPICIYKLTKRTDKKNRPFYTFIVKNGFEKGDILNLVGFRCRYDLESICAFNKNEKNPTGYCGILNCRFTIVKNNGYWNFVVCDGDPIRDLKLPPPNQAEKWKKAIDKYKPKLPKQEVKEEDLPPPMELDDFKPMEQPEMVDVNEALPPLKELGEKIV